ncbi:AMP-binding protein [Actinomadura sp. WMMA1423]|uniref:AMP-binding protein n=1 Tax=Actinomadura sp. WMMA1423 TaxID=2591108 RepID=UPI001146BC69|nr:AMP-binding protein [Actinomadura sp. WMMA1423]
MPDWTISAPGLAPTPARELAARRAPVTAAAANPPTLILTGDDQPGLAAATELALQTGHRVVLAPPGTAPGTTSCRAREDGPRIPGGLAVNLCSIGNASGPGPAPVRVPGSDTRAGWDLALFTSGSTTGRPRGYGFTAAQLDEVTRWYSDIYRATTDSIIVTALPAHYNFTCIAGVLLAARLGARLHFSTCGDVLKDAERLAADADRVIVLANPVLLDQATPARPLPTVVIDSGGAPLSTTAITDYRAHGIDVREGYGLTETASLTHFDTAATTASLGTVGPPMPGVTARIVSRDGLPLVEVASPATAVPLDLDEPAISASLLTSDVGAIDGCGRLRLLGRADDHPIGGLWPRDTLDALGPILGRRCALVRHSAKDRVSVRTLTSLISASAEAVTDRVADFLGLPRDHIALSCQGAAPLLHSAKLTRRDVADTAS